MSLNKYLLLYLCMVLLLTHALPDALLKWLGKIYQILKHSASTPDGLLLTILYATTLTLH